MVHRPQLQASSADVNCTLGASVPAFTPHAISVSLPTWRDNVGYEEGEARVVNAMVNGYPRFFIHLSIQRLAKICQQKFGVGDEECMLFPTAPIAALCRTFIADRSTLEHGSPIPVRLVEYLIHAEDSTTSTSTSTPPPAPAPASAGPPIALHIALYPPGGAPLAKQFWQHTGMGVSSRVAERCLALLGEPAKSPPASPTPPHTAPAMPASPQMPLPSAAGKAPHKPTSSFKDRYAAKPAAPAAPAPPAQVPPPPAPAHDDEPAPELDAYLEERYGRNMPLAHAGAAKRAMRRRLAGVLVHDAASPDVEVAADGAVGPSSRGVAEVSEHDVFLYPTGMTAIWQAHALARAVLPPAKSICFGFPYTDTLKILQKWGPGCHFFGNGSDGELDALEALLAAEVAGGNAYPALALFTEFPSNPLLRTADLVRLRALADRYGFLIVIDETLANFVNVEILPYADVVVSSLSKIFSGDANVMGGSLILNPAHRHYAALKAHMDATFEDFYFDADAVYMERNSRDFRRRIELINTNTLALCTLLRARSLCAPEPQTPPAETDKTAPLAVKEVFYPAWGASHAHYDAHRLPGGGFGGLFSLTFGTLCGARAFFDALACAKGPSLGTNFTLACPYTVLAHYAERGWAAAFGVEEGLVRVSVGMEHTNALLACFERALQAAEDAVAAEAAGAGDSA